MKYIIILLLVTIAGCGSFHSENVSERPWNEPRGFQYPSHYDGFYDSHHHLMRYHRHGIHNQPWLDLSP